MLCISAAYAVVRSPSGCLSFCLSITFVYSVEMIKHIIKLFSPASKSTMLFLHRKRYINILSLTVSSNAGGYEKIAIFDPYLALSQK